MKYIPFFIFIIMVYICIGSIINNNKIPDDAIRIRIIANSNSKQDQEMKTKIKDKIEYDMYNLLKDVKKVNQARRIINNNISLIDRDVNKIISSNNYDMDYNINYGYNYFPDKQYKDNNYEAGYYESLVVTLGEGKGDNWWCILFPPICLMEAEESTDIKYTTMAQEIVDKYF